MGALIPWMELPFPTCDPAYIGKQSEWNMENKTGTMLSVHDAGDQTQGFVHPRQAGCRLSHVPSPQEEKLSFISWFQNLVHDHLGLLCLGIRMNITEDNKCLLESVPLTESNS